MPIPQRPRTPRYLVAKWDDLLRALNPREMHTLVEMLGKIAASRRERGLSDTRQYVVVSDKNRPMYDEVWGMVLAEIEEQQNAERDSFYERLATLRSALNERTSEDEPASPDTGQFGAARIGGASVNRNQITIDDVESSYQTAWAAAATSSAGRVVSNRGTVQFAQQWQPAIATVEEDGREPANVAVFDLETDYNF